MITSDDDGQTWSWPRTLLDGPIDDRDSGVLETAKGTLLVTTFTSLAYEPVLAKANQDKKWDATTLAEWNGVNARLSPEARKKELGVWAIRSTDGGVTWSERVPTLVNSPHGPIQLADGRLLYAGKDLWGQDERVGFCESSDDGQTWRWLADITPREGDKHTEYHELHAVETGDKRIIAQIRNHNPANQGETLQCESSDGGKTWTTPRSVGVWGLPSHLLKLRDGRLLMTYGHRRAPLGNQARVSTDHGRTWSEPIVLSGDGITGDLGYPSTVELADGTLLSVWYEVTKGAKNATLRQARWRLPG
jgi:Neuraminidase (sialidase)